MYVINSEYVTMFISVSLSRRSGIRIYGSSLIHEFRSSFRVTYRFKDRSSSLTINLEFKFVQKITLKLMTQCNLRFEDITDMWLSYDFLEAILIRTRKTNHHPINRRRYFFNFDEIQRIDINQNDINERRLGRFFTFPLFYYFVYNSHSSNSSVIFRILPMKHF